ncbi:MAG: hypothetical protein ABIU11_00365 [Chitinophagaceae bacterium]
MKMQIVIFLLLIMSASSFAQKSDTSKIFTSSDYLKKSKKQNTAAWIFLGGGFGVSAIGLIIGVVGAAEELYGIFTEQKSNTLEAGEAIFYVGLASMVTSIPFFIASSKNKKRANGLSSSFKLETRPVMQQGYISKSYYPVVALKLNL